MYKHIYITSGMQINSPGKVYILLNSLIYNPKFGFTSISCFGIGNNNCFSVNVAL